jgi:4-amino-4-deoxy-L-arabinose transferase-like glycosyltransferase
MAKISKTKRKSDTPPQTRPAAPKEVTPPATRSPWNWPAVWSVALGLVVAAVILYVLRRHFIDIPLERDESAYAYLGKRALEGQIPYRDFYEMKPPLLFYSYAVLVALFGYSAAGLHWAALALGFWNSIWVYAIGARFFGFFYGFVACLSYVLLIANPFTTAMLAESELVLMAFILPGLYCLLRWDYAQNAGARRQNRWLFVSGFLLACGVLVRQSGVFFFGVAALLPVLVFWQQSPRSFPNLLKWAGWAAAGALAPVIASLLFIQMLGVWDEFWFWNVEYGSTYASSLSPEIWMNAFSLAFSLVSRSAEWYWVFAGLGLVALLTPRLPGRYRLLLPALAVVSFLAVTPGKRFYTHYWLQLLPALALLMAAFFYHAEQWVATAMPRTNWRPVMAGLTALLLLIPVARFSPTLFRGDYDRILRTLFPGNPFPEDKVLADLLAAKMQPDDQVAVLGSEPQYYVYLDKKASSKHFYMAFTMRPIPQSEGWQQEALDSIKSRNPRFIVFNFVEYSWMPKKDSKMILYEGSYRLARQNYRPVAWADMVGPNETTYILKEEEALRFKPAGQRYITVYERKETAGTQ